MPDFCFLILLSLPLGFLQFSASLSYLQLSCLMNLGRLSATFFLTASNSLLITIAIRRTQDLSITINMLLAFFDCKERKGVARALVLHVGRKRNRPAILGGARKPDCTPHQLLFARAKPAGIVPHTQV